MIGREENGDGIAEPVEEWEIPAAGQPRYQIPESDDFTGKTLGLQWQWQANPRKEFFELGEEGLSLFCLANESRENLLWYAPNLLTQIPQHPAFKATARIRLDWKEEGDLAALGMTGQRYAYLALKRGREGNLLCLYQGTVLKKEYEGEAEEACIWQQPWKNSEAWLRLIMEEDGTFRFACSENGKGICRDSRGVSSDKGHLDRSQALSVVLQPGKPALRRQGNLPLYSYRRHLRDKLV